MDGSGDRWIQALQERAARLAFPDWRAGPDDWTSLYTSFGTDGAPVTEVAVYRGHERLHHRRYTGAELTRFWTLLIDSIAE
ncbi:hypothetical protein [Nonomuraea rhizosphaerae]|uniref:hypothetical protein n=1 Tax=Nonomuraea rhizosphaerae TaxID=2665663 RepID=UPI001C5FD18C|nr:hypothetical protein [Nonomuraea rhizosphaerae]